MKQRLLKILTSLILLLIAGLGAFLLFLRSEKFQEVARNALLARLKQATASSCTVGRFRLELFKGTFQIERFEMRASAVAPKSFSLEVDEVRGSFGISLMFGIRRFRLNQLTLVRPRFVVNTGKAGANLDPDAFMRVLNQSLGLEVGQVEVLDGWLDMNNQRIPLQLSMQDLTCEIRYAAAIRGYRVRLDYRQGRLFWAGREIVYDLDLRANITAHAIEFETIEIRRNRSVLAGRGVMREWISPRFLFQMSGSISEEALGLFDSGLREARGDINVRTDLSWSSGIFHCSGNFQTPAIAFRTATFRDVQGALEVKGDHLFLRGVSGTLEKGEIEAEGEFRLRSSDRNPHRLKLSVKEIAAKDAAEILGLSMIDFQNKVDSTVRVTWRNGTQDLMIEGKLRLHEIPEGAATQGRFTELRGESEFKYSEGIWHLSSTSLYSPKTQIQAESIDQSTFHVKVTTERLSEILTAVRPFVPSIAHRIDADPDLMDISGSFQAEADIRADSGGRVTFEGPIRIKNAHWRKYDLDSLRADSRWDGETLDLRSLSAAKGEQKVAGDLSLKLSDAQASATETSFRGSVQQLDLASLKTYGFDFNADLAGALRGTGSINRTSGSWNGGGEFSIEHGSYNGEKFDRLQARLQTEGRTLRIAECQVARGSATVTVRGEVALESREIELTAELIGFDLKDVAAIRDRNLDIEGRISAQGNIRGTLENPRFRGTIGLQGLRYASWALGGGQGTIVLENKVLHSVADVRSNFGRFKVQADISAESGYAGQALIELQDWNVRELIADNIPSYLSDVSTALQGKVKIEGRFEEPSGLRYSGELDGARFKFRAYELRNAGKVRFTAQNQRLHVEEARVVGEGTNLTLSGDLPLNEDPSLNLRLSGLLSLKIMEQVNREVRPEGAATLNVRAGGSIREIQIFGQATLNDVRLEYGDLPFRLASLQGNISFSRNLVRFDKLQGIMASGSVQIMGALEHNGERLSGINLQMNARGARMPYPKDFRSTVDADLFLRGTSEAQVLSGQVKILRSEYTREFSLLEQFLSRPQGGSAPLTGDPLWAGLRLNVGINSDDGLQIQNELASLRAGLRLTLRGTPAYPTLLGRAETKEGSIYFRGSRFEIVRGVADFIDRNRINPSLDVRAEADIQSYRIILDLKGELDRLSVNITSDPPLSTVDIVSLLTTGKSYEGELGSTRRQSEITGLSAASILSEGLTDVLGKRMHRLFGLESFRVAPFLSGKGSDPTARITVSERISRDLSITFSRNLSTNEEQIVLVEYDVNKNLSIIASRDEDGKFALDFRFRRRFR